MPYSQFTSVGKVKETFQLRTIEGVRFLPELEPITPSETLLNYLAESLPVAIATGSEKARSEGIVYPVLLEVRRLLNREISLFSGEDFTVDESVGLNGVCDFLLSRSPEQLDIETPAVIIIEAKKADLKSGLGQCIASMIAAQRFNEAKNRSIPTIYGSVSNGSQWRFIQLQGSIVTIDLADYPLPPVDQILAFLVFMAQNCALN
ncbi:hypothetical protein C7H19_12120 [Aphanothece hegewaldii CCALA 016]|uniref:Uncharacterized protein n=1 Tax=Aphanothece hegewaldii CCALA 016 TaxID=2107694 RepID=A0A2T1LXS2_9CHRO|nr:hypothetical protein [Aphanothece hegewaldii]PSF37173.1 hypothetical protein C7H19_12120 [Aphanothece hegewaldii CCALA 016]